MGDHLELAPGSRGSKGRLKTVITRLDEAGETVGRSEQFFDSDSHYAVAARFLGVNPVVVMKAVDRYVRKGQSVYELEEKLDGIQRAPLVFRVRKRDAGKGSGAQHDSLAGALAAADGGSVVEWDDCDRCCMLDLDFHSGSGCVAPDAGLVLSAAECLRPTPTVWWLSKSGGLHAVYLGDTAEELAASAGVSLQQRFPGCGIELKHATHAPPGEVVWCEQTSELPKLFCPVEEGRYDEWLEERGFAVGQRYSHELCPVMPSRRAAGNSPPVVVYADHIYCHICAADGVRRGSKTPGYFPLARLAGVTEATMFDLCVRNFAHWGHARHVVAQLVHNENLARCVYRAALRRRHGDDPRIALVYSATPATGLVRYDGYWAGDSGRPKAYDRTSPVLAGLPVCKKPDEEGELKTDMRIVEELASSDDLSAYGYPALTRVWGMQLTQFQDLPTNRVFKPIQRNGHPQYLPVRSRLDRDSAWGAIEALFPGVDRRVVELLVVAKGCSEHRVGLPPMVFLSGPTGAGKTQTVNLAASICGDSASKVLFATEIDRVRRGVLKAKETGSFAFFDEYLKTAKAARTPPDDAMEMLLTLEPDSVSHVLYVGPVPLGELPVCVWADTVVPTEVASHSQIGRRMHYAQLQEAKEGWSDARDLRKMGLDVVRAADSVLSWVVDDWFGPGEGTDFAEVARALGFKLLRDTPAAEEKACLVQRLFELVCKAQPVTGAEKRRWSDPGWVLINLNDDRSELTECWKWLADVRDPGFSRSVSECDLKRVLGLRSPARLETSKSGNKVAVRFVGEGGRCNGDLELAADKPRLHGRGNAERGRPEEVQFEGVPEGRVDATSLRDVRGG